MKIESLKSQKVKLIFIAILFFINGSIFNVVLRKNASKLKIVFLDIGQGDSIFIESPTGNQILIDGGPNRSVLSALGRIMSFYDKNIDAIIATHPDADHVGGFSSIVNNYSVDEYFNNGATTDTGVFKQLQDEIERNKIKTDVLRSGEIVDLGGGAILKILWPESEPKGKDTNSYSIITELYYGKTKILLTGDAPTFVENKILSEYKDVIKSDILKVAHHGSKNSLSESFLSFVNPTYSVISAGLNNRYGHPHKAVTDYLQSIHTNILKTYESGDIIFESDGNDIERL